MLKIKPLSLGCPNTLQGHPCHPARRWPCQLDSELCFPYYEEMRDDKWLLARLDHLWSDYFSDVAQINPVFIRFGRFARIRFGSIRLDRKTKKTYIIITGMFKDEKIPQEIVDHTIAHELCHYAHGFSSPHKKLHRFPHEGGVIKVELENRGLIHLYKAYREWIKEYREELKGYYKNGRVK